MPKKVVLTTRGKMLLALVIFVMTACFAVITNGLMGRGAIDFRYSISRYVGLETISAVVFALGNFVVAYILGAWLCKIGRELAMPKAFYWLIAVMVVCLVGLSVCPIGYFDQPDIVSVPSRIHEICSRTMFACMMFVTLWLMLQKTTWHAKCWCAAYIVYAVFCTVGYLWHVEWFLAALLVFESCYLVWFLIWATNLQIDGLNSKFIKEK